MNPIKTALLAYGFSGKIFHAPFLATNKGFELYAALERNNQKAKQDFPDVKSYASLKELLADDSIELVVVNTPNNTHFELAKQSLQAKKHVLLEKPATTTPEEFLELIALAQSVNKQLLIYQNRRWSSDICAAKEIIKSGKLGDIIEIHLRFDRFRPDISAKAFKENELPGSGILYDLGSHLIDQAISIFVKPKKHYVQKGMYRNGTLVDDYAFVHLLFENQVNAFITVSLHALDVQPGIIIHGTKGSFIKDFCDEQENQLMAGMAPNHPDFGLELESKEGKLTYVDENNTTIIERIPSQKGNFNGLFDEVYACIREHKPFSVTNEAILEQIKIVSTV
ncbi:Gfo/Idh/MocA family protein [Flavobacterium sp. UBA6135]|uniref:Gfo/Idh/MocA family protein n=1 Tax=Flavobacterium sp. UBA6135 TaxID=1946553 RepID=UPI0025BFC0FA|nr:Gfo/Idh/MocA family oxidoreductase [Flavobacterium sp. UBA6135]